jgi:dihydropteroate synthase
MGILNATPDSFYDGGRHRGVESQVERAGELLDEGADLIDVGGQSAVTNRPAVAVAEEVERVVPLVERIASLGAVVSVDTYRADVASAAIDAGAVMINDPSGLSDPDLARVCANEGAALVVTHTRARPKEKLPDPRYADVVEDVKRFLHGRLQQAQALGIEPDRLLVCPGPDLGKEPAQTVELLRRLDELHDLGRPILLSVSRKDFVGALLGRPPSERLAGTLAAIAHGVARGARVLRVHDVAETRDFLTVSAALNGELEIPVRLRLDDELRWEPTDENVRQRVDKEAAHERVG